MVKEDSEDVAGWDEFFDKHVNLGNKSIWRIYL